MKIELTEQEATYLTELVASALDMTDEDSSERGDLDSVRRKLRQAERTRDVRPE